MGEAGSSGGWVGTILRIGAAPAVLVGLIAWVLAPRWGEVVERGGLPSTAVVVAVVVANVVANGGLAWMWVALVRSGSTDVDVRAAVRAHAVSLPARYVAPGGHVPARAAAARRHGLSVTAGVGLGGVEDHRLATPQAEHEVAEPSEGRRPSGKRIRSPLKLWV
ncbi:MAG: hypothetical protein ABGZ36_16485, partial [Actinomycetota bacterium]